ncbi:MAG: hypothetical protein VX684_12405 [Planctomycetota bacterium]|nr:hypothetical protein [Planctomycetota bacterium]
MSATHSTAGTLLATLVLLAGCTTKTAVFPDRTPEQVWTVMVAAARFPDYSDWTIMSNDVWIDGNYDRLEIHRRLKRDYHQPQLEPVRQVETYDLQFVLERTEPPAITGTVRNTVIPVKGAAQLDLYFEQVRALLSPTAIEPSMPESPIGVGADPDPLVDRPDPDPDPDPEPFSGDAS